MGTARQDYLGVSPNFRTVYQIFFVNYIGEPFKRPLSTQHRINPTVFSGPERVEPILESATELIIIKIISPGDNVYGQNINIDHNASFPAAHELPHGFRSVRVRDGDVDNTAHVLPHGGKDKGDAPGAGLEQVPVRGFLFPVFFGREPGPFHEVHY